RERMGQASLPVGTRRGTRRPLRPAGYTPEAHGGATGSERGGGNATSPQREQGPSFPRWRCGLVGPLFPGSHVVAAGGVAPASAEAGVSSFFLGSGGGGVGSPGSRMWLTFNCVYHC